MSNENRPNQNQDRAEEALTNLDDSRGAPIVAESTVVSTQETGELLDEAYGRGEGTGESAEVRGLSQGRIVARRFFRHTGALVGMTLFALIALLSFITMGIGPIKGLWWEQETFKSNPVQNGGAPTLHLPTWLGGEGFAIGKYPFGQSDIGEDTFALVMSGIQTSIIVMFVLAAVVLLIGVTVGALSGYFGGKLDYFLMRFTDLVITLPVIVVGAVVGRMVTVIPNRYNWPQGARDLMQTLMPLELAVLLGLVLWPGLARLLRAEFMSMREREFVDAARVAGASNGRIILKHILPNTMGIIIVNISLLMSTSVVLETALSFLNFGINPPSVSLGYLINKNSTAFATRPWLFWWPGLFIILMALSVNFIGDGLRDAFDPRTKRIPSQRKLDRLAAKATLSTPQEAAQ